MTSEPDPAAPTGSGSGSGSRPSDRAGVVAGAILIVLGLLFLAQRCSGLRPRQYGWPLFVILPASCSSCPASPPRRPRAPVSPSPGRSRPPSGWSWPSRTPPASGRRGPTSGRSSRRRQPASGWCCTASIRGLPDLVHDWVRALGAGLGLFVAFGLFFEGVIGLSGDPFLVGSDYLPIVLIAVGVVFLALGRDPGSPHGLTRRGVDAGPAGSAPGTVWHCPAPLASERDYVSRVDAERPWTSEALVERARRGDQDAFAALVDGPLARLDAAARLILRDARARARRGPGGDGASLARPARVARPGPVRRLAAPAHRECLPRRGAARRRRGHRGRAHPVLDDLPVADASAGVADRDLLDAALRRLDPEQRAIVVLRFFLELSLPETADALGIPLGTVKSRLHRSLVAMRIDVAPTTGGDVEPVPGGRFA